MVIPRDAVWVFDLDDTLYKEIDYQTSGFNAVANFVASTYGVDVTDIIDKAKEGNIDVFQSVCEYLEVPAGVKESFLWIYRLHFPDINLDEETSEVLEHIGKHSTSIEILTDGRSTSQRLKIIALGLEAYSLYTSEDWGAIKPDAERFVAIMQNYPNVNTFVYVGDNVKKDFVTPNKLGWLTIGLKDNGLNIHQQDITSIKSCYLPNIWVKSLKETKRFIC